MSTVLKRYVAVCVALCLIVALLPWGSVFAASTQPVSVKNYGAVGNGTADDHEAIQSAVDAAAGGAGGGVVAIPAGTYLVKDFIVLKSNITLQLDDAATIVNGINYASGPSIVFLTGPYTRGQAKQNWAGVENVTIIGGTIDMNGQLNADGTAAKNLPLVGSTGAFALAHSKNVRIEGVTFLNNYKGHTIQISACDGVTITGCSFKGQSFPNDMTSGAMNNKETIRIEASSANSFPYATNDTGEAAKNIIIENCSFAAGDKCGNLSVAIGNHDQAATAQKCNNIAVMNNTFKGATYAGVRFRGFEGVTVQGNTFIAGKNGIELENCGGNLALSNNAFSGMSGQNVRLVSCGGNGMISFYTHGDGSINVSTAGGSYTFTAVPDEGSSFRGYYKQSALTDLITTNATVTFPVSQSSAVYRYAAFATCNHSYTSKTTEATCTKDGSVTYTCTICGDSYSEEIEATGHSYTSKKTAATCTKDGSITYTCKNCGHSYSEVINATGHNYASTTIAATCTKDGSITYTCKSCGDSYSEVIKATGHAYTAVESDATCTTGGGTTYTCGNCGHSYVDAVPATGHSYTSQKTAATCTKDGSITYTCKNCGHSYSEVIKATGHNYASTTIAATCTKNGSTTHTCKNCGDSYSEVIEATGHAYTSVKTDATCTTDGGTTYTCGNCGHSYVDAVPATGHSFADGACIICGEMDPDFIEYYLVGYINGANHGCEEDYLYTGNYKFVGGKLTATFETPSYVFVKTGDNANWYMSEGYCQLSSVTLYNTSKALVDPNKLFVPGGVEITFTLTVNSNDTLTLSYEKGQCNHEYTSVVTAPTCEKDGYTTYTCVNCGESHVGNIVLSSGHSYVDNVCSVCGEKAVDDETPVGNLFTLVGANMILGGELDMNFFIESAKLIGTDYYAKITLYTENETITTTIGYEDWEVRSQYMVVTQRGLAARQMADRIEVVIYHGNGVQASALWADSVRDYAMRIMEKQNDEAKTLLVDMLNYGAAAQIYFEYNADDLANKQLSEQQKAYATQTTHSVDQREKGMNYVGSTLTLKNRILLTMYFANITPDMYAVISFTDHKGGIHENRVEGDAFVAYSATTYGVVVDDLVVADGEQLVTIRVYNAEGVLVGQASDTINSYAVRQNGGDQLFEMVQKFTASAYAYFH